KALEHDIRKIDNLVVINSTDAHQRSWVADEWAQTAFGHYLQEGLKGAADLAETGRVNAYELYLFVRAKVERWAYDHRDAGQLPILLPSGFEGQRRARNIELTVVKKAYKPPPLMEAPFLPTNKLIDALTSAEELLEMVPSPAVYSPHLLTHYLETQLRYV